MKHIIILISLLTASFILSAQEHPQEYKVVCKRVTGCPVINGTCPTCVLVGGGPKRLTSEEWAEWGKQLKESLRYQWDPDYFKDDTPEKEQSGWEWGGPTWKGLRVLY